MTERIERVDGEFHYATWDTDPYDNDGTFEVWRKSDGKQIAKWFWGEAQGPEADGSSAVREFDETARHHREAALAELDAAAAKADPFFFVGHKTSSLTRIYEGDSFFRSGFTAALLNDGEAS